MQRGLRADLIHTTQGGRERLNYLRTLKEHSMHVHGFE